MKGRFRKGKKAYRGAIQSPRQASFERRYQRWIIRTEHQKKVSIELARAALIAGSGAMAISMIQSQVNITVQERAIAIANQVIDTYRSIAKVFTGS